jgi:hypothetical protein
MSRPRGPRNRVKYSSGEEPKVGDTVLGAKLKGRVALLLKDQVQVMTRPQGAEKARPVPLDPADLTLVHRG